MTAAAETDSGETGLDSEASKPACAATGRVPPFPLAPESSRFRVRLARLAAAAFRTRLEDFIRRRAGPGIAAPGVRGRQGAVSGGSPGPQHA
jgi:hypothetical protein